LLYARGINMLTNEAKKFFNVADHHRMVYDKQKSNWKVRHGIDMDDLYYTEYNNKNEVIAIYHAFHHVSLEPPKLIYKQGWTKYDPHNKIVDGGYHYPFKSERTF